MLIYAMITMKDLYLAQRRNELATTANVWTLRSCLLIKKVSENYVISVKNSKYPDCIHFNMTDLEKICFGNYCYMKLFLLFKEPWFQIEIECDNFKTLTMLSQLLQNIHDGKEVMLKPMEMPEFDCTEFVAVSRFDQRILNMKQLNKLVLENCDLSTLPVSMGQFPIEYLSLSYSKLVVSENKQDTFWVWMSGDTICNTLSTLTMDSIGLERLPFEIIFFKKLETLSVAHNKLTYLPPYVGEMRKLLNLNVADNSLYYFPNTVFPKTFNELDISNNRFAESDTLSMDHINKFSMRVYNEYNDMVEDRSLPRSLMTLSINNLMFYSIKFKRQDIPNALWDYIDVMGRCVNCFKYILPDYSVVRHIKGPLSANNLTKSDTTNNVAKQKLSCRFRCHSD